jgi:hypothetical protein
VGRSRRRFTLRVQGPRQNPEHVEQRALVEWARLMARTSEPDLALLFAVPSGGFRPWATAKRLAAEGVQAGIPDLMLPVSRWGWHGMFLELKAPLREARPSNAQLWWMENLTAAGYYVVLAYGCDAARAAITYYLTDTHAPGVIRRASQWVSVRELHWWLWQPINFQPVPAVARLVGPMTSAGPFGANRRVEITEVGNAAGALGSD